ncbi:MAG: hypothetical protein WD960_02340 [Gemmatimonadota bacterium]
MGRLRCVFFILLALVAFPVAATAQLQGGLERSGDAEQGFRLGQNYPNPFNPDTRIPFELYENAFPDGQPATVTIRIYNILQHYIASPTALNHASGEGTEVVNLEYGFPGRYEAYWDGRNRAGQRAPSGVYVLEMSVNGRPQILRMFLSN